MNYIKIKALLLLIIIIAAACGEQKVKENRTDQISQQSDGTIALKIEDASCYVNQSDPANNTAEWKFMVKTPGRYNVWLATATVDTMDLMYPDAVKINLEDERLEAKPVGDKIILDSSDVTPPYYRADSFMGTFYIQQPGEYSIQVISEKAVPAGELAVADVTESPARLMSVILTPKSR